MRTSSLLFLVAAFLAPFQQSAARTVKTLRIDKVGFAAEPADHGEDRKICKIFRPTRNQIIRFFNRASSVEKRIVTHERYSPCTAAGEVTFTDGLTAQWALQSSGTATLIKINGGNEDLFYRFNQWNDPFVCSYGLGKGDEC